MAGESSSELVRQLQAEGMSYADIGRELGRNRSLVRQVGIGAKPGHNLQASLEGLRARLAGLEASVPPPPRRETAAGRPARVRRTLTHEGRGYSVAQAQRQGAQHGAKGPARVLARAPQDRTVAVTATYSGRVYVDGTSGGRAGAAGGFHAPVQAELGTVEEVREAMAESGQSLSDYVSSELEARGYIHAPEDVDVSAELHSLQVRTY